VGRRTADERREEKEERVESKRPRDGRPVAAHNYNDPTNNKEPEMVVENTTSNNQMRSTQTIPYYIENFSKADYERWFAERVRGGYPKLYFADARFAEGIFWRDVTIDFSGVLIGCIHSMLGDEPHWMTPDAPYFAMLGRLMALANPILAPALMDYACRFEFDYDDSPIITVKGEIFADTLTQIDVYAEGVAQVVTTIWPHVVTLFTEAIPSLNIKKL
jgi:hypothetical protein